MSESSWSMTEASVTAASASSFGSSETVPSFTTPSSGVRNDVDYSSTLSNLKEAITTIIMKTKDVTMDGPTMMTTTTTRSTTISTAGVANTHSSLSSASATVVPSDPLQATTRLSVSDLSSSLQHFGFVDYFVFVLMLAVCAAIGFYFGFIEKKKKKRGIEERRGSEALDYLVGGRKMKVFPVSLSLVASFVSGISLLGTSTEIYVYGTQYAFILITLVISGIISWYVFLPVFCNLQLTSTYEYFEMRFDKGVRLLGSVLFSIGTLMWLPIVIYVPALAFNQVTGVNIHIVTPVVCIVCIFYTCVGGLKAVVWTDVIQTIVMLGAIILVIIKGTLDVGGLGVVYERNLASGRIEAPEWTFDPTVRLSMLSIFVGSTLFYVQCTAGNQVIMQRYLSVPGLKQAKRCLILFTIGVVLLMSLTFYNGLLIFATYHDCDPLTTKLAKAKDQLVPLLVMDILRVFPGIPGLFVAGVFSAALSSLSTGLNSLAAVILEDYIKPLRVAPLSERQTGIIMRTSVVVIGCICVALVFVVEYLGTHVIQLSMTLSSISCGPLLGMFLMGLLLPFINGKSAITGCVSACLVMTFVCIKAQIAMATGELVYPEKSVTTEGCTYSFDQLVSPANSTSLPVDSSKTILQYIYHMSFLFYAAVGAVLSIVFACLSCCIFGYNDPSEMNISLFSPFIQRLIKPVEYVSVHTDDSTVIFKKQKNGETFST